MIVCPACEGKSPVPQTAIMNAESLERGDWYLRCDCGHVLSTNELLAAGAVVRRGPDALSGLTV